jgi:phosphohistidine phosphatase
MKRLILLRHAKSGWDDPVARDFDRPLNARGMRAAKLIGQYANTQNMNIDHIVASPAVRVVETLDEFFAGFVRTIEPQWDRRVYLASSATLLDILRETAASIENLMLVGHNPGLEDLVLNLIPDDGSAPLRELVEAKFPTASLVVMSWNGDDWCNLGKGPVSLESFTRPRDLDPELGPEN